MLDWLRRMLGMTPSRDTNEHRHEEQEQRQQAQFDTWADTKREVTRVQDIAERGSVPVRTNRHAPR